MKHLAEPDGGTDLQQTNDLRPRDFSVTRMIASPGCNSRPISLKKNIPHSAWATPLGKSKSKTNRSSCPVVGLVSSRWGNRVRPAALLVIRRRLRPWWTQPNRLPLPGPPQSPLQSYRSRGGRLAAAPGVGVAHSYPHPPGHSPGQ